MLQTFHAWLEEHAGTIPGSTKLGDAIGYALHEWPRLEPLQIPRHNILESRRHETFR
ncbi:MAG: IS66 family transposase [Dysgonamonadaceae bacterium]|nr:IS66 family transposase [Dysgonamonadaceae bacterium]